jgi:hypothetical protein
MTHILMLLTAWQGWLPQCLLPVGYTKEIRLCWHNPTIHCSWWQRATGTKLMSCDALVTRVELKLVDAAAVGATAAAADGILLQGSILAPGHKPPH